MARYCAMCGKELKKSDGPVGPTCMRKHANRNLSTSYKIPDEIRLKYLKKHDIFGDDWSEQAENVKTGSNSQT